MLMTKERRLAIRTLRGSAIAVLNEAHAIRACEEHGCRRCLRGRSERRFWPTGFVGRSDRRPFLATRESNH
jgi:hypothetical protein